MWTSIYTRTTNILNVLSVPNRRHDSLFHVLNVPVSTSRPQFQNRTRTSGPKKSWISQNDDELLVYITNIMQVYFNRKMRTLSCMTILKVFNQIPSRPVPGLFPPTTLVLWPIQDKLLLYFSLFWQNFFYPRILFYHFFKYLSHELEEKDKWVTVFLFSPRINPLISFKQFRVVNL